MKNYKMICEQCGHTFGTTNYMAECPECGDYETTEVSQVAKVLSDYESTQG